MQPFLATNLPVSSYPNKVSNNVQEHFSAASFKSSSLPRLLNPLPISEFPFKYNSSRLIMPQTTENTGCLFKLSVEKNTMKSLVSKMLFTFTHLFYRPRDQNERIITNCYNWEKQIGKSLPSTPVDSNLNSSSISNTDCKSATRKVESVTLSN